jgi:hypothetical protein
MFSEGTAAHPAGCDTPLQIEMEVWRMFFFLIFLIGCDSPLLTIVAVWRTSNYFKKSVPNGHDHLKRVITPDQITQQNSLQRAGGP